MTNNQSGNGNLTTDDIDNKDEKEEAVIEIGGLVRPPMNQDEFDKRFFYKQPEEKSEFSRQFRKFVRSYYEPFTSLTLFKYSLFSFIPIIDWLPDYKWREDLLFDMIGGLTVGIMHVPQGSFAVVSLMTGIAVDRITNVSYLKELEESGSNITLTTNDLPTPIEVASVLTLTVGVIQFLMGFFRLSFLTTYFSDQVVAGFTTGACCHVFVSQLKDLLGLRGMPKRSGPGYMLMKLYDIALNLHRVNPASVIISVTTITVLVVGKEIINPLAKKRFKLIVPIPFELLVVILATLVTYVFQLNPLYRVKIAKSIPTGMPEPSFPRFSLIPHLIANAIGISIVVVAVHMSLAKMFGKKLNYSINPGQELYALGLSSIASGFLPVYPVACSLGRTLVNVEAGTKTQV
uniref:Sulfate_transp domain-containing protein n=1 Tax=Heterorhabditis bacteriophora TaxID=37862 RepID=A0A1I7X3H3_HETBA